MTSRKAKNSDLTGPRTHVRGEAEISGCIMIIELPFPAPILWPNGRGHYMRKHKATKTHKGWARVAALANQFIGLSASMDINALNRLLREGNSVSGAYLTVDPLYLHQIYKELIQAPRVAGTVVLKDEVKNFYESQAEAFLFFIFIATLLAGSIAFGVIYNSARIALSERSRELASLRVLGYTRGEIAYILLGELMLLTLAAIPLGFLIGRGLGVYMSKALESDLFRIPLVVEPVTYSMAAAVVLVSTVISGIIVSYRLYHLDLVGVLKTKE